MEERPMSTAEQEMARVLGMTEEEWECMKRCLFEAGASPEEAALHVINAARTRRRHKEGS
jgi:hypothetical protein